MSSKVGAKNKGYIKNLNTGKVMKFQYNPENFEYSRGATYVEIVSPGMSYPDTQYVHGNARSFPIELFFYDKPYSGVIRDAMNFLGGLLPPEKNNKNYKKPPVFIFCYGYFIRKCVLEDLSIKIEEFNTNGKATIARFTLTIRQVGIL